MGTCDTFEASKRLILLGMMSSSCDRSPKGSIDEPIRGLLRLINGEETGYVSTSSCSGRIVLFLSGVKQPTWLLVEHKPVMAWQVHECLDKWIAAATTRRTNNNSNNNSEVEDCRIEMKFEPLILHVQARDMNAAQALLRAALQAGFRESGIICGNRSGRIMVAVRTLSPLLSAPVVVGGELIVCRDYLERLTDECNQSFHKNVEKTHRLEMSFRKLLVGPNNEQQPNGAAVSPFTKQWKRDLAIPPLRRYGHCTLHMGGGIDSIIVLCGYGASADGVDELVQRRSDVVALRNNNWATLAPTDLDLKVPLARESAAAVALGDNACLLFGGRSSPSNPFGDVWRCRISENGVEWSFLASDSPEDECPSPRWGHSMHVLSPDKVLIVGGRNNEMVFDDLYLLSLGEGGGVHCRTIVWSRLNQSLPRPSFYHAGSCIQKCGGPVAIHGGLSSLDESSGSGTTVILDVVTYDDVRVYAPKVKFMEVDQDQQLDPKRSCWPPLTSWFAHATTVLAPNTIVFVGGVVGSGAESQGLHSAVARIQQGVDGCGDYSWEWVNFQTNFNMEYDAGLMAHGGVVTVDGEYVLSIGGGMLIGGFGPRYCSCWRADIEGLPVHCLMAARSDVKLIKMALERGKMLDKTRRISHMEENTHPMPYILPLVQLTTLAKLKADDLLHSLISDRRALPVTDSNHESMSVLAATAASSSRESPLCKLKKHLYRLLKDAGATSSEASQLTAIALRKRPEMLGDVAVVDESLFKGETWSSIPPDDLWGAIATFCQASRVALWAEGFDLTATMFSRNNIREKKRMGELNLDGEIVVDLFAGIGYWTLHLLKRSNASFVHACDINPDSVAALRYNLVKNGVDNRCTVHLGDNRITAPPLGQIADRVILGLLPSSREAWPVACAVLSDKGGWLHVHGNCRRGEEDSWSKDCLAEILYFLHQRPPTQGQKQGKWQVQCTHIERVKSYSPHVYHLVVDIFCSCILPQS